jgi:hypothetical protein
LSFQFSCFWWGFYFEHDRSAKEVDRDYTRKTQKPNVFRGRDDAFALITAK